MLLTNHALPRHAVARRRVRVALAGAGRARRAFVSRIDEEHANAKRLWREMGEPKYPSRHEVERLEDASRLREEALRLERRADLLTLEVELPPQGLAAIAIELERRGR